VVRLIELDKRRPFTDGVPPAYLAKMAFTLVVDEVRRGRRETLADGDGSPRWEPPSSEPNPETGSASRELGRAIRDCVEKLSRNRRHAVQLMLMGHTNQEIARRLGWGAKQAENFVTRGRSDLRECLTQKGFGRRQ
jgi:DNA-directed RNA polymerase specialized sigma24 family protein